MMKLGLSLLLIGLSASLRAQARLPPQAKHLALTHVTVIDATGVPAKPDTTVVIVSGHIVDVGATGKIKLTKDSRIIDGTGKFLIPGLWDSHVHLSDIGETSLALFVANGITSVRQMGSYPRDPRQVIQWRKEIAAGQRIGPRIFTTGWMLTTVNRPDVGHIEVPSAADGRRAVEFVKNNGADFVKVHNYVPREAYFAIAEEARRQKTILTGHVPFTVTVAELVRSGQRGIEHLGQIPIACSSKEEGLRSRILKSLQRMNPDSEGPWHADLRANVEAADSYDGQKAAALFSSMVKNGVMVCPTLANYRADTLANDSSTPLLKYIPAVTRQEWLKEATGNSAEDTELQKKLFANSLPLVRRMHEAGVQFLAGTDSGMEFRFPGFDLHTELALLVEAGLTPMEALQTATVNPARWLGVDRTLGTVEQGKIADLVLLDANPLDDIHNTEKIHAVVMNGRFIPKSELQAMLTGIEAQASK
jgi:hypothetical protein